MLLVGFLLQQGVSCLDLICLADVSGKDLDEALLCGARARGQKIGDCVVNGVRSGENGNGLEDASLTSM